ncbi:hypothetical protein FOA52_008864 [Chlamydomonas sp. UWO 241]|nr:hypothetical protein FOA52_008864 [Chlamydomonas sp. UWO 241]
MRKVDEYVTYGETQAFIAGDSLDLPRPLAFAKTPSYDTAFTWSSWCMVVSTCGMSGFCPISLFCPSKVTSQMALRLKDDSIVLEGAVNDCCFHVAKSKKTVPLGKVQDVQLQEGCLETIFGLKRLMVETAGMNGPNGEPEIVATFVANPDLAAEALRHAVKLWRKGARSAPGQAPGMSREGGMKVLTSAEATSSRAAVLAAADDVTLKLAEAFQLASQNLLSPQDLDAVKDMLLAQLRG